MKLLPHQIEDAVFLTQRRFAGCFSGMGSGKTRTALHACLILDPKRTLIVGPPISLRMWQSEAEDHLGEQASIIKTGREDLSAANIQICSYDIATRRMAELRSWLNGGYKTWGGSVLICDESHALKSSSAKRTKAILGRDGLVEGATWSWMLTGTPSTRWNDDMFTFLCRADLDGVKRRCGGVALKRFQMRFCITQKKQFAHMRFPVSMTVGNRNTTELSDWVYGEGLAVRRELEEVWAAMPPITHTRLPVALDLDPVTRAEIAEFEKSKLTDLDPKDPALATIRRMIGLGKVKAAVAEIFERADAGNVPLLVGAWHREVITALVHELNAKGVRTRELTGSTSAADKAKVEAEFNDGTLPVLVGQIGAMGVSLNLQKKCHHIIVVEEDWSPAIMDQFYARVMRIGQQNHVHVDTLYADLKLERAVARISRTKEIGHTKLHESASR